MVVYHIRGVKKYHQRWRSHRAKTADTVWTVYTDYTVYIQCTNHPGKRSDPSPPPKKKTSKKLCERGKKCSKPSPYTHPPPLPFNRQCPYKNNTFQRGFPVKDHHQLKQFHLFSADFFTLGIYILLRKLVTQNSHLPCPAKTDPYDSWAWLAVICGKAAFKTLAVTIVQKV